MRCTSPVCNSYDVVAKRKFTREDDDRRKKYSGINCTIRRYNCKACGITFGTVEVHDADFAKIGGHKLRVELGGIK